MLTFDKQNEKKETLTLEGRTIEYRSYRNLIYVENPVLPKYQSMNIFVPEAYYHEKSINGYTKDTAPVFMPNGVGGYMAGDAQEPGYVQFGPKSLNALFCALEHGYVVAAPAIRGSMSKDAAGRNCGKAPALLVDQKAAVRYLHYFADEIPGDQNRIITNGTSAGGALSALAGATGNHPDYLPYLKELGAADASDAVFAASCYCPITNLEHADMAYEWQFQGVYDFHRMHMQMGEGNRPEFSQEDGVMAPEDQAVSDEEAALFPAYLNSLDLRAEDGTALLLDENGEGSFKEYIKSLVLDSAAAAEAKSIDVSEKKWLTAENGTRALDFAGYIRDITRMKTAPAFDPLEMNSAENLVFGYGKEDCLHFTNYSYERSRTGGALADPNRVKLINPMYYLKDDAAEKTKHWRIRHGSIDRDTSLAVSAILALSLKNLGYDVDYAVPWNVPHSGDYDLDELFAWIDNLCKK